MRPTRWENYWKNCWNVRVGRIANLPVKVTFDELVEDTLSITAGRIEEKGVQVRLHKEPVTLSGPYPSGGNLAKPGGERSEIHWRPAVSKDRHRH